MDIGKNAQLANTLNPKVGDSVPNAGEKEKMCNYCNTPNCNLPCHQDDIDWVSATFNNFHDQARQAKSSAYCGSCAFYQKNFERFVRDYFASEIEQLEKRIDTNKGHAYNGNESDYDSGYNEAIRNVLNILR